MRPLTPFDWLLAAELGIILAGIVGAGISYWPGARRDARRRHDPDDLQ